MIDEYSDNIRVTFMLRIVTREDAFGRLREELVMFTKRKPYKVGIPKYAQMPMKRNKLMESIGYDH